MTLEAGHRGADEVAELTPEPVPLLTGDVGDQDLLVHRPQVNLEFHPFGRLELASVAAAHDGCLLLRAAGGGHEQLHPAPLPGPDHFGVLGYHDGLGVGGKVEQLDATLVLTRHRRFGKDQQVPMSVPGHKYRGWGWRDVLVVPDDGDPVLVPENGCFMANRLKEIRRKTTNSP